MNADETDDRGQRLSDGVMDGSGGENLDVFSERKQSLRVDNNKKNEKRKVCEKIFHSVLTYIYF